MISKYSAVNHRTPTLLDALLSLIIIGITFCIPSWFQPSTQGPLSATIRLDGAILMELPLETLTEPFLYTPEDLDYSLELEFSSTGVHVLASQCPGQDCVHQGHITSAGQQLICLPNRLSVAISGGAGNGPDFVLG